MDGECPLHPCLNFRQSYTKGALESTRGGSVATGPVACGEKWLTYENTWSPVGGAVGDVGGSTMEVGFEAYEPILFYSPSFWSRVSMLLFFHTGFTVSFVSHRIVP